MLMKSCYIGRHLAKVQFHQLGRFAFRHATCGLHMNRYRDYSYISNSKCSSISSCFNNRWLQLRRQSSDTDETPNARPGESLPFLQLRLVVIGTGAPGTPASFYLTGFNTTFLVNCGESVQRILTEHSIRMRTVKRIMCTSKDWRNIGGLLGMCLTLKTAGVQEISFHGDASCLQMARLKIAMSDNRFLDSQLRHYDPKVLGWYEDANFVIKEIELNPYRSVGPNCDAVSSGNDRIDKQLEYDSQDESVDSNSECRSTRLFVFHTKPRPPHINFLRCVELGVPAGTLIKQLKDHLDDPAFSLTLPNGRVVKLADICESPPEKRLLLVFECPSLPFLRRLLRQAALKHSATNGQESKSHAQHPFSELCDGSEPALVVHITRFPIANCEEYQRFIASFPQTTRHLVLDGSCADPPNVAPHHIQAIMHLAHPQLFPLLSRSCTQSDCNDSGRKPEPSDDLANARLLYARPGLTYLINKSQFSDHSCVHESAELHVRETLAARQQLKNEIEALAQRRAQASAAGSSCSSAKSSSSTVFPQFVFLGTGSSVPNKTRNVSGFLVQADAERWLLFDCGEGTYAQLVSHFGRETDNVLRRLRAIFISHMHADHHTGVFTMLNERRRAMAGNQSSQSEVSLSVTSQDSYPNPYSFNYGKRQYNTPSADGPRLVLVAPKQFASWLSAYIDIIRDRDNSLLQDVELISARQINPDDVPQVDLPLIRQVTQTQHQRPASLDLWTTKTFRNSKLKHVFASCGISSVVATSVAHYGRCYGYVLVLNNGIKMVYSGDTIPCQKLIDAGRDCDVLVHEATLDDEMCADAQAKRHSTVSQALNVARGMRARHCILTHFSQRYVNIPPVYKDTKLLEPTSGDTMKLGVAFDHMQLTLADIDFSRHLLPFLKVAFPDGYDLMCSESNKRYYKRMRTMEGFQ